MASTHAHTWTKSRRRNNVDAITCNFDTRKCKRPPEGLPLERVWAWSRVCVSYMHLTLICASTVGSQVSSDPLGWPAYPTQHIQQWLLATPAPSRSTHFGLLQLSLAKFHLQFSSAAVTRVPGKQAKTHALRQDCLRSIHIPGIYVHMGKMQLVKQKLNL